MDDRASQLSPPTCLTLNDEQLTLRVQAAIDGITPQSQRAVACLGPTYVALRQAGLLRQAYWHYGLDLDLTLNAVVDGAIAFLSGRASRSGQANKRKSIQPVSGSHSTSGIDTFELCFTYNYRRVELSQFGTTFGNIYRGIRGIELQYGDRLVRYSPTRMLAANLSFQKIFEQFLQRESITQSTFIHNGGVIQTFDARQVLVQLTPQVAALTLHRGNRVVPLERLSGAVLDDLTTQMGQWLLRQVKEDGRMVYKYFPSRGAESTANNLIRQFMATLALIRYATITREPHHWALASHNLRYNLNQFYTFELYCSNQSNSSQSNSKQSFQPHLFESYLSSNAGPCLGAKLGWVEYDGKAKLGAIALAALAILEYSEGASADEVSEVQQTKSDRPLPMPLAIAPDYRDIFVSLCATIDHLWQPDGSFRTFFKPTDRNDNQNFYPGEALLFWATLYSQTGDLKLLERCYTSVSYYQSWHYAHYNPAFIPWHTQAYALLYKATGDRQFLDLIFSMNDSLLAMQQWHGSCAHHQADVQGRFYAPNADYGPPHASSTGVYLEGLADAYDLAVQVQDQPRICAYETALWRGLRSLRQLQFRDRVDLFYVSKRAAVQGGIRTTVYDNVIRVDNVQHGLMALLKLKQMPAFQRGATPPASALEAPLLQSSAIAHKPQIVHEKRVASGFEVSPLTTSSQRHACNPDASDPAPTSLTIPASIRTSKETVGLQYFRLIKETVDIQPLLEELAAHEPLWLYDTSRQDKVNVQRETHSIYLRSAVKPLPLGVTSSNDVHESHYTGMAQHFPNVLGWAEKFAVEQSGELGRVTLVRLAPRGRVYRHIDHGDYYRVRDRFHLILHSPRGSLLNAGEEWVRMHEGECWWFDNKQPHEAYNDSDDWRIHLIFDIKR